MRLHCRNQYALWKLQISLVKGTNNYGWQLDQMDHFVEDALSAFARELANEPAPLPLGPSVAPGEKTRLRFAQWELDTAALRLCDTQGRDMPLTSGEFDLLSVFARTPGRVLSRDFLLEQTRGRSAGPFDRTIDVQVGRLRRKLEVDPEDPQIIKSVRGAGYILVPPVAAE